MRPPCELIVGRILPTIRAEIAKLLVDKYEMKQDDVANILGIIQSTVSLYVTGMRGSDEELLRLFPEIQNYIETTAEEICSKNINHISITFCDLCSEIRTTHKFCKFHKDSSHLSECNLCFSGIPNNL
jgi:predicted transcriptional regulator